MTNTRSDTKDWGRSITSVVRRFAICFTSIAMDNGRIDLFARVEIGFSQIRPAIIEEYQRFRISEKASNDSKP